VRSDNHVRAGRGVLHPVPDQVREHLSQPVLIAQHGRVSARPSDLDAHVLVPRHRRQALGDLLHARAKREGLLAHTDAAGADTAQLEQALDHVREALALPVDHAQLGGLRRVALGPLERVDVALDHGERRPQLVRHLPDERGASLLLVREASGEILERRHEGVPPAHAPAADRVADHAGLQSR
jgi:hypothetical protein